MIHDLFFYLSRVPIEFFVDSDFTEFQRIKDLQNCSAFVFVKENLRGWKEI